MISMMWGSFLPNACVSSGSQALCPMTSSIPLPAPSGPGERLRNIPDKREHHRTVAASDSGFQVEPWNRLLLHYNAHHAGIFGSHFAQESPLRSSQYMRAYLMQVRQKWTLETTDGLCIQ
mmetsp:Transcript_18747/g.43574  ORF Transcript_18747/g.43574 Transcript_18747/m.43574 type:complete len:120 (+) Transcript_18747:149-508(+)